MDSTSTSNSQSTSESKPQSERTENPSVAQRVDSPGSALGRALKVCKEEGTSALWFRGLSGLGYRRLLLLERPLSLPIDAPVIATDLGKVEIGLLDRSAVPDLVRLKPDSDARSWERRFDANDACMGARIGSELVSVNWACQDRAWVPFFQLGLELASDEVWLDDAWTMPAHRGMGLTHALVLRLLAHFRDLGYRRALSGILPERQLWSETGFRACGRLMCFRLGPWSRLVRKENSI